ncbi:MAG: tetratricopeptide repeat protein [Chlamydiales bacterium]|nr:tetratricopeptide repeat protein [Chlamydiales bacterium]
MTNPNKIFTVSMEKIKKDLPFGGGDCIAFTRRGDEAMKNKDYKLAVECYMTITTLFPDFDQGDPFVSLAQAYEKLGDLDKAEEAFRRSLEDFFPDDYEKLEAYASFLIRNRPLEKAIKGYLNVARVARLLNDSEKRQKNCLIIFEIGEKIGWSKEEIQEIIDKEA